MFKAGARLSALAIKSLTDFRSNEMKKFAKMALATAIATFTLAASATYTIDSFTTSQNSLFANPLQDYVANDTSPLMSGFWSEACGSGIIGGCRDLFVSKGNVHTEQVNALPAPLTTINNNEAVVKIGVSGSGGLAFSQDEQVSGVGIVRWDGKTTTGVAADAIDGTASAAITDAAFASAANYTGLGGINLTLYGNAFELNNISTDGGFTFILKAYTDEFNFTTLYLPAQSNVKNIVTFADFANDGVTVGTMNWTSVGMIEAEINPFGLDAYGMPQKSRVDLSLGLVQVVPEPESLALMGLGLIGLAATRRRKAAK